MKSLSRRGSKTIFDTTAQAVVVSRYLRGSMSDSSENNGGLSERIETEIVVPEKNISTAPDLAPVRQRTRSFVADLRIHTPEAMGVMGIEGIQAAPALVRLAKVKSIDLIGITDFYGTGLIDQVSKAAAGTAVTVIPGTTVRARIGSCDDVVLLCLLREGTPAIDVEALLSDFEVPLGADNLSSHVIGLPFEELLERAESHNALIIPSRMDKTPHRASALPALVERYGFRAFDLAYEDSLQTFKRRWPRVKFNLLSFSNAHALAQVGSRTSRLKLPEPGFSGLSRLLGRSKEALQQRPSQSAAHSSAK